MAEDDSPTGSYSALDSSNIALRSLNRRRDMHRSQDVSSSNSSLRNSRSTATLRNKKWRKQKDSEAEDEANDLLLPAERGAMGQGETEGVYDQGWKGTDGQEEDDTATIASTDTAKLKQETKSRWNAFRGRAPKATKPRTIPNNAPDKLRSRYPPNIVRNQKYNVVSFLPIVLYEQFKFFFNLYFLLVAVSQIVPALRIGFLATYVVPLAFVLIVTIGKEAYDDYKRFQRDQAANSERYQILDATISPTHNTTSAISHHLASSDPEAGGIPPLRSIPSSRLRVGDLVLIEKNQRVPADCVLLRTSESTGTCFIRTDQLDGETDWKSRVAVECSQGIASDRLLLQLDMDIYADPPTKDIHTFIGTLTVKSRPPSHLPPNDQALEAEYEPQTYSLSADNLLWSNTVLAAGQAIGFVIYTGRETRAVMNTSHPETKVGLLDLEINRLAKILCAVTFVLSVVLVALNGFRGQWYIYIFRFLILFSSIIPISLRVNLDMGKTVYAHQIMNDNEIPGTIVRTSTLPEELGRIEYLLSDKTGTLTQNEMELKKLHLGTMSYGADSMDEVAAQLNSAFEASADQESKDGERKSMSAPAPIITRGRRDMSSRVRDVVLALALCHNVTPVFDEDNALTYQASSPDEVAIVRWTESVGLTLINRDRSKIELRSASGATFSFEILDIFPFTSESKRMGLVVRDLHSKEVTFYQKGADVIMAQIVQKNDWLEEECGNMAREGLRTLVIGRKRLSDESWKSVESALRSARVQLEDRNEAVARAVTQHLEQNLELLGVTGVEDKLQDDVRLTLELLRNAGIKIWMLTGDKIETATCIAISSKLVARNQYIHQIAKLRSTSIARDELEFLRSKLDCCLVIDGESLQLYLTHFQEEFIELATKLPTVVACRCSPTQKADVARLIRTYTKKRVCCIGDGGNDVSMIQAADVGLGIVGKEGKQASLAADFSILQFSYLSKLLCWHGRNSYKRSAKLAQFIIHRGLLVAIIQAVFSSIVYFSPVAIFQDWLSVGYATIYTMGPVFSLVLDTDLNEDLSLLYPELYAELTKGRSLSYKTFFIWVAISVYQGGAIMIASMLLFETEFINIVAIAFTATILNELVMVATEVTTWHPLMVVAELGSLLLYAVSMAFLPQYFDLNFVLSLQFLWKVGIILAVSAFPLVVIKWIKQRLAPASYSKVAMLS